jgi:hypothetical protein
MMGSLPETCPPGQVAIKFQNLKKIYMAQSTFKNWHTGNRAKAKELSNVFPVSVSGFPGSGIEIKFEDEYGRRIVFKLTKEHKELMLMHLARIEQKTKQP